MVNKVILAGHTGDVIKMHFFEGGGCIGRLPLATNSSYQNKTTGEKVEKTEWHQLVFRNKGAEIIQKYITTKGAKLYIEGRIETRKWQDADGGDRYSVEIHVLDFKFLDSKSESQSTQAATAAPSKPGRENSAVDKHENKGHGGDQFLAGDFNQEPPHDDLPF